MNERSEELDSELRRASTQAACKAYLDQREAYNEPLDVHPEALTETLIDLVCDLHHLCDLYALDWRGIQLVSAGIHRAEGHHAEETACAPTESK